MPFWCLHACIAGSVPVWTEPLHHRLAQKASATPDDSAKRRVTQNKTRRRDATRLEATWRDATSPNEPTYILCGTNQPNKPMTLFSPSLPIHVRNECNASIVGLCCGSSSFCCCCCDCRCRCRGHTMPCHDPPTHLPPGDRALTLVNRSISGHRFVDDAVAPC